MSWAEHRDAIYERLNKENFAVVNKYPLRFTKVIGGLVTGVDLETEEVFFMIKNERVLEDDGDTLDTIKSWIDEVVPGELVDVDADYEVIDDLVAEPTKDESREAMDAPTNDIPERAELVENVIAADVVTRPHNQALATYSPAQIETIKNTVAKGISDNELNMFIHISQAYGLDPFLNEIFYSSQMKKIMTSRDGYLKIAQRDPTFEGIQSMAVCENDVFEIDAVTPTVIHKFGKGDRGKAIGGWAMVHKIGRRPVISYADIQEYKKNNNVWHTYPSAMICKVAEAFALKRQFGISGLVTDAEMG